ncbi:MAG: LptA/OstA family protein [Sphingobium sp.]|nr:LptA/OstA family protein [Sphingobium sp.]
MTRRSIALIPAGLVIALAGVLTLNADAQVLKNHDSNAPVNFTADRIEVQDRADRVVVSGNVEVTQAGMKLNAARMTVAYRQGGGNGPNGVEIDRIDASGNVVVTRGNERASGNVAIYDLNSRLITMIGNVALNQGANRLTGGRLVMDLNSGRSTVDGRSSGGGAPGVSGSGGRVSGTFSVPQRRD